MAWLRSLTKLSTCMTVFWASCSTPRRTSISNSFRHPAKRSMPRYSYLAASAKHSSRRNNQAKIHSPPSRLLCHGTLSPRALPKRKSSLSLKALISYTALEKATPRCVGMHRSFLMCSSCELRWQKLVVTDAGIDRRYYELCALSEMKNALRSGDIWVQGSRQFKDFEEYLVPPAKFVSLKQRSELPLAVATDCDHYLHERLTLLETQLATANRMAQAN